MSAGNRIVGLLGVLVMGGLGACGKTHDEHVNANASPTATAPSTELTVFAAASLREACGEVGAVYEKQHGAKLVFNFGASNALAQQIVASRKGDVFISADEAQMDVVEQAQLVAANTRSSLLSNQLVVVQPMPWPAGVAAAISADALVDASIVRLSLANPEAVPAGKYAKAWLEKKGVWDELAPRAVPGVDVRAALATVESGAAQAGIVYATDAAMSGGKVVVTLRVPLDEGPRISYPVAVLACSASSEQARALVEFLHGVTAHTVFTRLGFVVIPSARSGVDDLGDQR